MPEFSVDYLSVHLDTWKQVFNPEWKNIPLTALEIGSYEGLSACWLLDNVLKHPDSRIVCVDNFIGIGDHNPEGPQSFSVRDRFLRNLSVHADKVQLIEGDSRIVLKGFAPDVRFHLIYVDGDHSASGVLSDAVMAFHHLTVGGLMIFDDYLWMDGTGERRWWGPKEGIDAFLTCFRDQLKIVSAGHQLMVSKTSESSKPL